MFYLINKQISPLIFIWEIYKNKRELIFELVIYHFLVWSILKFYLYLKSNNVYYSCCMLISN